MKPLGPGTDNHHRDYGLWVESGFVTRTKAYATFQWMESMLSSKWPPIRRQCKPTACEMSWSVQLRLYHTYYFSTPVNHPAVSLYRIHTKTCFKCFSTLKVTLELRHHETWKKALSSSWIYQRTLQEGSAMVTNKMRNIPCLKACACRRIPSFIVQCGPESWQMHTKCLSGNVKGYLFDWEWILRD